MIIQSVLIRWTKETRGEPYASLRSRHPIHFPVANNMIQPGAVVTNERQEQLLWHQLSFEQTKEGIALLHESYEWLPALNNEVDIAGELPGIRWMRIEHKLIVYVHYDHSFGKPVRTNGQSRLLDEKAFELLPLQYGQITINGRHTMEDGSVYEQRVMNIWNVMTEHSGIHTLKKIPDYQYKQHAALW